MSDRAPFPSRDALRQRQEGPRRPERRWSKEETQRRLAGAPLFRYDPPDGPLLNDIVAEYEAITGVSAARPGKHNFIASCYRVHGPSFIPLVRRLLAERGTETNLLGSIRTMQPEDGDVLDGGAAATGAGLAASVPRTDPSPTVPPVAASGPFRGLTYGPDDRPPFEPTSKRRYDRRPSNPDAADLIEPESDTSPGWPSPDEEPDDLPPSESPERRGHALGEMRPCPACQHEHPVGTTCLDCEHCLRDELTDAEEESHQDLVGDGCFFGGFEAHPGLSAHNRNLRLLAACDGTCAMAGCPRPYFDDSGLTRHRGGATPPSDGSPRARRPVDPEDRREP